MELKKLTGPQAGSIKYDLLTALAATGLRGSPMLQTSLVRLSLLITARYNWRLDEVSIGQVELARLWSVDLRTVKREIKRLTDGGWLKCLRPGVRGRVGAYRLDYGAIHEATRESWQDVGSDFAERMAVQGGGGRVVAVDFSTPRPGVLEPKVGEGGSWDAIAARLCAADRALYDSWFARLSCQSLDANMIRLSAPNRFVARYIETHLSARLDAGVRDELGSARRIVIESEA